MKFSQGVTAVASIALWSTVSAASICKRVDPAKTDPYDDPFYAQPANIASYQPGDVINFRTVQTNYSDAVQLKFRTTDGQGNAVSTLATLWSPLLPHTSPSRIVSYQYAEDAVNLDCAPSWALVKGSGSQNSNFSAIEAPIVVPPSLNKGYYVVQPDAEGPESSWLVGNQEGKATLDAIRAVINYKNLNKTDTQVGLYGYSGGAHSTVWAAELQESYASDLNIVGAAFGGTPIDLQSTFELVNGGPSALLGGGALFGLAQGYPALEDDFQNGADGLTDAGKQLAQTFRTRNFCFNGRLPDYANQDFNQYFKNDDLLANPTLRTVISQESLLSNVSSIGVPVPKFPRFQYHGDSDTVVPYAAEAAYVQQQCDAGADIQFLTVAGADHAGAAVTGIFPALNFLDQAFNNLTPKCECGTVCIL